MERYFPHPCCRLKTRCLVDHYDWVKDFDPADPFGSNDSDKPKTPKPVEDYKHPEGWLTDSILLINDPGLPQFTEGRLPDYLNRVRGLGVMRSSNCSIGSG